MPDRGLNRGQVGRQTRIPSATLPFTVHGGLNPRNQVVQPAGIDLEASHCQLLESTFHG